MKLVLATRKKSVKQFNAKKYAEYRRNVQAQQRGSYSTRDTSAEWDSYYNTWDI